MRPDGGRAGSLTQVTHGFCRGGWANSQEFCQWSPDGADLEVTQHRLACGISERDDAVAAIAGIGSRSSSTRADNSSRYPTHTQLLECLFTAGIAGELSESRSPRCSAFRYRRSCCTDVRSRPSGDTRSALPVCQSAYRPGKQLTNGMSPGHCCAMFGGFAGGGGGGIGVGNLLGPSQ